MTQGREGDAPAPAGVVAENEAAEAETPLIHSISDAASGVGARLPDAASGPFGAVGVRDQFSRPLHVETDKVNFDVTWAGDGEIDHITWKSGEKWTRQADGTFDLGGEQGRHLKIDARSGVLTWQNMNGQMCFQYPDGDRWVEGANRARKTAA